MDFSLNLSRKYLSEIILFLSEYDFNPSNNLPQYDIVSGFPMHILSLHPHHHSFRGTMILLLFKTLK